MKRTEPAGSLKFVHQVRILAGTVGCITIAVGLFFFLVPTVRAESSVFGYICPTGTLTCDENTATFAIYEEGADTYLACTPNALVCNSTNAIYTAVRDSGTDFYICKGSFPVCNVANGNYYMEKNDQSSFYVCEGKMPVCNVANGSYYIEKDTENSWDICEGRIPVCNLGNDTYIFQKVAVASTYQPEPASYTAEKISKEKPTPAEASGSTSVVIPFHTTVSTTAAIMATTSAEDQSGKDVEHQRLSFMQKIISWVLSFF